MEGSPPLRGLSLIISTSTRVVLARPLTLASDSRAKEKPTYYAIKILTVNATKGRRRGHLLELEVLEAVRGKNSGGALPYLFDHFETSGHLCLVQPVLSTSVFSFRCSAPSKQLGFQTVKVITEQVLEALVTLHAEGFIHTGV